MKEYLRAILYRERRDPVANIIRAFFWLLSWIYRGGLCVRSMCYRFGVCPRRALDRPVISVGNLTMGGSGKTPLVALIARYYREQGLQPVILTRGYMAHAPAAGQEMVSDEAQMLREMLPDVPVLQGKDRWAAANDYLKTNNADVFILDDGFQHWRLARQLDIVVLNGAAPLGPGGLLPAGTLREPSGALRRADLCVITKANQMTPASQKKISELRRAASQKPWVSAVYAPGQCVSLREQTARPLESFSGERVVTLTAIGDPESFRHSLCFAGVLPATSFDFLDHHGYDEQDLKRVVNYCLNNAVHTIMTSHKDEVKLRPYLHLIPEPVSIYTLHIELQFHEGKEVFFEHLRGLLSR